MANDLEMHGAMSVDSASLNPPGALSHNHRLLHSSFASGSYPCDHAPNGTVSLRTSAQKGQQLNPGKQQVDLQSQPPGMYIYRIRTPETLLKTEKLLKR